MSGGNNQKLKKRTPKRGRDQCGRINYSNQQYFKGSSIKSLHCSRNLERKIAPKSKKHSWTYGDI